MSNRVIRRNWQFAVWLLLLAGLVSAARADEQVFADYNCAFTPPEGWQLKSDLPPLSGGKIVTAFRNADNTELIMLVVPNAREAGPLDDRFVTNFEAGVESSGAGKRIWGKFVQAAGVRAYESLRPVPANGKSLSSLGLTLLADGKTYELQALSAAGAADLEPDIQKSFASFRFLKPPVVPAVPASGATESDKIGYQIGQYTGIALVVVVLVVLVARFSSGRKS